MFGHYFFPSHNALLMEWAGFWTHGFRCSTTVVGKHKGLVAVALTSGAYLVLSTGRRAEQNLQMQEANSCPQAGLLSTHQLCSCRKALMPGDELAQFNCLHLTLLIKGRPMFSKLLGIIYSCKNMLLQKLCHSPLGMNMFSSDNVI